MKLLCRVYDHGTARRLIGRLAEAEIRAFDLQAYSDDDPYSISVWVAHEADIERASSVLEQYDAEGGLTRLEPSEGKDNLKCNSCGYDLRGHCGDGRCPECGLGFLTVPVDVSCPHCSKAVPGNFETCWNCGGRLAPKADT